MIVLKRVLVTTDFSSASDAGLAYGRALARRFAASLHVLHVSENFFLRSTPSDLNALLAAKARAIDDRLTDDDRSMLAVHTAVAVSDDAADAIVSYARREAIDAIVVGTHGRTGVQHLVSGSVAEHVVRGAPCPVLTVRQLEHEFVVQDYDSSEAPMILLRKILVATDFSEPSDAALAYGQELARTFGAQLLLAHVVDDVSARAYGPDGCLVADPELQRDVEAAALHRLEGLISGEDREMLRAEPVILTSHVPASALVQYASTRAIDLIVMGTHGRSGISHLLMGSVAERVVRTAPCPVLTVRHPEREFLRPDALVAVTRT
ncbi:MAG TPA: universal stress protein [Vicinamibacterales bacterium]|nr:universal stress protein [Vicinamibacterales bacterium]